MTLIRTYPIRTTGSVEGPNYVKHMFTKVYKNSSSMENVMAGTCHISCSLEISYSYAIQVVTDVELP